MKNNRTRILCSILCLAIMLFACPMGIFADRADGAVSDSGTDAPLTPGAGTVQGTDGNGALSDAVDSVSEVVSGVVDNAGDSAGMSVGAVVLICIIIAVAIGAVVILLIPRRHD